MAASPLPIVCLHLLGEATLQALIDRDLQAASAAAGLALPEDYLNDGWLWTLRLGQRVGEPACAPWLVRAIVVSEGPEAGVVVGHAGFHGPPDAAGTVEVGYRLAPGCHGHGYARAALVWLMTYAATHGARRARAAIDADNVASRRVAEGAGLVLVGQTSDEPDWSRLVFERQLT
jgi:ribosomal-protein-alanine N-acetyltransferase